MALTARIWGCRGSMAKAGPATLRYGGNTSCVEVRTSDATVLVLDCGTGAADLGAKLMADPPREIHLLLTHLHMDHIQGLGFFTPLWTPGVTVHVWGPASSTMTLEERLARYLSPPLFPVGVNDMPSNCAFHDAPETPWTLGSATVLAAPVEHPGPTVGFRIEEGDRSLAYIPDHEPARVADVANTSADWLPGGELAYGVDVLLHDSQYTEDEYPYRVAWGHSSVADTVAYAQACKAENLVLFHHDPSHGDEQVEAVGRRARDLWGVESPPILAREGMEVL